MQAALQDILVIAVVPMANAIPSSIRACADVICLSSAYDPVNTWRTWCKHMMAEISRDAFIDVCSKVFAKDEEDGQTYHSLPSFHSFLVIDRGAKTLQWSEWQHHSGILHSPLCTSLGGEAEAEGDTCLHKKIADVMSGSLPDVILSIVLDFCF